jgi:hypothetical protein
VADAPQCYYVDGARNQQGPVAAAEIGRLVRNGTIRRDTLVWYPGMPDWRPAGQVSEFASLFTQAAPPPRPPSASLPPQAARPAAQAPRFPAAAPERMVPERMVAERMLDRMAPAPAEGAPTDGLVAQLEVWGLFWRVLVAAIGNFVVIPAPWTATMIYRYVVDRTWLPSGRRLTFAGKPGDIWYVLIGIAALGLIGQFYHLVIVTIPLSFPLSYLVFRWLCEKVGSEDGSVKLAFTGSIWGYIGWSLLILVSVVTIIGWAWALQFFMRWVCRNISGTVSFDFAGTGWGILWRTLVVGLASIFLIPIPWMLRWYWVWLLGQVRTGDLATHFD